MDGVEEMVGLHQRSDAIKGVVVDENRPQELLFGLDVVGQGLGLGLRGRDRWPKRCDLTHLIPPFTQLPYGKAGCGLATLIGLWTRPVWDQG